MNRMYLGYRTPSPTALNTYVSEAHVFKYYRLTQERKKKKKNVSNKPRK